MSIFSAAKGGLSMAKGAVDSAGLSGMGKAGSSMMGNIGTSMGSPDYAAQLGSIQQSMQQSLEFQSQLTQLQDENQAVSTAIQVKGQTTKDNISAGALH